MCLRNKWEVISTELVAFETQGTQAKKNHTFHKLSYRLKTLSQAILFLPVEKLLKKTRIQLQQQPKSNEWKSL